jgi:hypothetical protein
MREWIHESPDMVVGSVGLVLFLVFCFAAGKVLNSFKNARFAKAWSPLVPLINGTVINDGGGAATSWLTGTYQGRKVQASMIPGRNRYSGESGFKYNHFDVELLEVPGGQDWKIVHETKFPSFGEASWHIETADAALKQRLEASGVIPMLESFGSPTVEYRRRQGRLSFSEDAGPSWIPTPERFEAELAFLLRRARLNDEVNPAVR